MNTDNVIDFVNNYIRCIEMERYRKTTLKLVVALASLSYECNFFAFVEIQRELHLGTIINFV